MDELSPAQAARELGVTSKRIRQMCDEGKLTYRMTALGRLIDRPSLERLKAQRARRED